jgi:hypothetical protein
MIKFPDKYYLIAVLLFLSAFLFVAVPLVLTLTDFVIAALVISGLACVFLGSIALMFSGNESFDRRIIGLLPVQGCNNLCQIVASNGFEGNAFFLPTRLTGETRVMQLNPVSANSEEIVLTKKIFSTREIPGLLTIPASDPLIRNLWDRNPIVIPDSEEEIAVLISEVVSDDFEFASHVSIAWEIGGARVTLHKYRFIEACLYARSLSQHCCTKFPCPACSFCGSLIAEGLNQVTLLKGCTIDSPQDITAVFSYLRVKPPEQNSIGPR